MQRHAIHRFGSRLLTANLHTSPLSASITPPPLTQELLYAAPDSPRESHTYSHHESRRPNSPCARSHVSSRIRTLACRTDGPRRGVSRTLIAGLGAARVPEPPTRRERLLTSDTVTISSRYSSRTLARSIGGYVAVTTHCSDLCFTSGRFSYRTICFTFPSIHAHAVHRFPEVLLSPIAVGSWLSTVSSLFHHRVFTVRSTVRSPSFHSRSTVAPQLACASGAGRTARVPPGGLTRGNCSVSARRRRRRR